MNTVRIIDRLDLHAFDVMPERGFQELTPIIKIAEDVKNKIGFLCE